MEQRKSPVTHGRAFIGWMAGILVLLSACSSQSSATSTPTTRVLAQRSGDQRRLRRPGTDSAQREYLRQLRHGPGLRARWTALLGGALGDRQGVAGRRRPHVRHGADGHDRAQAVATASAACWGSPSARPSARIVSSTPSIRMRTTPSSTSFAGAIAVERAWMPRSW